MNQNSSAPRKNIAAPVVDVEVTAAPWPCAFAGAAAGLATAGGAAESLGAGGRPELWILGLAVAGIALTTINMFGGFAVTQRMLEMFRK